MIVSAVHNVISSRYESCYKKQKEAIEYFTRHGYSKKLTELDSLWISEDLMEDLVATTAELCNEEGFVEIASIFPPSFTSADQMLVLKQIDVLKREGNDV